MIPRRFALGILPIAVLAVSVSFARARGPVWLGTNHDPEYTYLLSALGLTQSMSPKHTDHPGTSVQLLGAAGLQIGHALLGQGEGVVDDTLTHPERYLRLLSGFFVLVYAATLYVCGRIVWTASGSLVAALLAQATPFLSSTSLVEVATFKPEPLLLICSASFMALLARAMTGDEPAPREGVLMGLLAGLALATKITAAPLLAIPLVLLRSWRARLSSLIACGAALALVTLPAWKNMGRFLSFQTQIVRGHGLYGLDLLPGLASYGAALRALLAQEVRFFVVLAASVALWAIAFWRTRREPGGVERNRLLRVLLALVAVEIGQTVLVLKQPYQARYLTPALGLVGLNLACGYLLAVRGQVGRRGRMARTSGTLIVLALAAWQARGLTRRSADARLLAQEQGRAHQAAENVPGCPVVTYYRASAVTASLLQANRWSDGRFSAPLERLYPGSLFLYAKVSGLFEGRAGFENFGGPLTEAEMARFPCLVFQGSAGGPDQPFSPVSAFQRDSLPFPGRMEVLYDGQLEAVRLVTRSGQLQPDAPFSEWSAAEGLGEIEGPYPQWGLPRVRWGESRISRLTFESPGEPVRLTFTASSYVAQQTLAIAINGRSLGSRAIPEAPGSDTATIVFDTRRGSNELTLRYDTSLQKDGRSLSVLFRTLRIDRTGASEREPAPDKPGENQH